MQNYLLSISTEESQKHSTIHDPKTKLKISVFDTLKLKFYPCEGEVRFFVTCNAQIIAFETIGYKKHRELLILHMISWYCVYLGFPDAKIHATWPVYENVTNVV